MTDRTIRALLIEDNPGDAILIREMLRDAGRDSFLLERAERLEAGLELLRREAADVVLLDLSLPDSQGLATLSTVRANHPMLPVVVLTGFDDEETAVRAVREGAQDYLVKGRFDGSLLVRSMRYGIERKRVERALQASEERFRSLVEGLPVGIFIVQNGRIVYQNPEQRKMFGPMPENFEVAAFRDVHPEDTAKFAALCAAVSGNGELALDMDLRFYPYGKSSERVDLRWVHASTCPLRFGEQPSFLVDMVNITRLKEMEHQVILREKLASLGHVAAGIAHEIRNPLSGINIHLSALQKILEEADGMGAEARLQADRVARQIQSASQRIESVIKKVMEFARPTAIRTDLADIGRAIEEAIDFSTVTLRKRGITLDRSRLGPLPKCPADASLITQVIMNLITNAAQALERAEGDRIIGVASEVRDNRIVVCVSDSGPGVPPEIRDKIFDPFYTTRQDGYGIGLSFSRRVVTEHHGALTVDASRWGGAEFRIELPLGNGREPAGK
ncbi:MAG: PAS domain-containing sensor histidine kinase [Deltaproteobacteria bacterium]|nr:MAG: PAS domain-containing sensor histidine kinase [Deltaproteobacteria bacterium]